MCTVDIYDVTSHKDFISGEKSKREIIEEFLNNFDGPRGNNDGVVTKGEFFDYYGDLSMSIPSDDYFVQMMESTWCISEDEQSQVFKEQIHHLVGLVRHRLLELVNNSGNEAVMRKMFKDFDLNASGHITIDELASMCACLLYTSDAADE